MKFRTLVLAFLVLISAVLTGCGETVVNIQRTEGEADVIVFKVGKADAILIVSQNHTFMIDCGLPETVQNVIDYMDTNGIDTIDYLLITHFDNDHVGGAAKIIQSKTVKNVLQPSYEKESEYRTAFINAMEKAGITPTSLLKNMNVTLDDVEFMIYPPLKFYYATGDNDYSVAVSVKHGENSFLFTGDAMNTRLLELYEQLGNDNMKHDFLKVQEHGDFKSEAEDFFNAVSPEYAAICDSATVPASDSTIEILSKLGTKVYRTAKGSIYVHSDKTSLAVKQ